MRSTHYVIGLHEADISMVSYVCNDEKDLEVMMDSVAAQVGKIYSENNVHEPL